MATKTQTAEVRVMARGPTESYSLNAAALKCESHLNAVLFGESRGTSLCWLGCVSESWSVAQPQQNHRSGGAGDAVADDLRQRLQSLRSRRDASSWSSSRFPPSDVERRHDPHDAFGEVPPERQRQLSFSPFRGCRVRGRKALVEKPVEATVA